MEVRALFIRLLMTAMILLCAHNQKVYAVFLHIAPNRSQFFEYESITFYCEGVSYCDVHKVKGKLESCSNTNKRTTTGSSCTIKNIYTDDSGEYWYETGGEKISNILNLIVAAGSVILESPVLPVMVGEDVTLRCRNKMTFSNFTTDFYRDGRHIYSSSTGSVTVRRVSKSNEGLYKCSISGTGESPESWLIVTAGSVILESPALPVMEGEDVTLLCKNKRTSSNFTAAFYKDGRRIRSSFTGKMTIHRVSKVDEGLYKCSISGAGESPGSWLNVTVDHTRTPTEPSSDTSCHIDFILRTVFIIVMVAVLLLVVGLLHCGKVGAMTTNCLESGNSADTDEK